MLIPQQLFRSFPLTESVTKIAAKLRLGPATQTRKARGGLIPEGWGGGESGLIIVFCFVLFFLKVDGPLTVQLKVQ